MANKTQMALVRLTYELLEDFLCLKATHRIVDIYADSDDRKKNQFRVKIVGPKMPNHIEGFEPTILPFSDIKGLMEYAKNKD